MNDCDWVFVILITGLFIENHLFYSSLNYKIKIRFWFQWLKTYVFTKIKSVKNSLKILQQHNDGYNIRELNILIQESYKKNKIDYMNYQYFKNIYRFNNKIAKEVMVPRTEMSCLFINKSIEENLNIILKERYTRYPLINKEKDNILGIINTKNLLHQYAQDKDINLFDNVNQVNRVLDTTPINSLLKYMQKYNTQMVILVDEYGGVSGLITIEDIIEEIVGDIQDEFDYDETPSIQKITKDTFIIEGKFLIEDFNIIFKSELNNEYIDTVGGWIFSSFGDINEGFEFIQDNIKYTVLEKEALKIKKIKINLLN